MATMKEVLRHGLYRVGLGSVLLGYKRRRGYLTSHLEAESLAGRFTAVYDDGVWVQSEDQESRSGAGSELSATEPLRADLADLLADLDCSTLVDLGCGDFNWMSCVRFEGDYVGVDIVPGVISSNSARYASDRRRFMVLDATRDPIPSGDVVLCREVLFHLSFADGQALLRSVAASGASHLIATSDPYLRFNADIPSGDYRPLNLQRRPYRLRPPRRWISDDAVCPGRALGVWRIDELWEDEGSEAGQSGGARSGVVDAPRSR